MCLITCITDSFHSSKKKKILANRTFLGLATEGLALLCKKKNYKKNKDGRHRRETSQATTPINPRHVHILRALNQEAVAAEMSLTQSHCHLAAVFIESYPIYKCGLDIYTGKKSNNDTVFGGEKMELWMGLKEKGQEMKGGKERWSFDSFTSHSRHAWLICLLFFLLFTPIPLC